MASRANEVLLVSMPFGLLFSPSLGLSLLKGALARHGVDCSIRYFSIRFAELIGQGLYAGIASDGMTSIRDLAGEWIFSHALLDAAAAPEAQAPYIDEVILKKGTGLRCWDEAPTPALVRRILRARGHVEPFLDWCVEQVVRERPRLVGFTSVFQQHVASLALARRLKRELPDTFIVFGGANCEGVMGAETVRRFPWIDAAVSGEADLLFPELVRRVLGGERVSGLQGVRTADTIEEDFAGGSFTTGPFVQDMDSLPFPDYSEFFTQFAHSRFGRDWQPDILFETSRGCWWGERMHCTFCGLNGATMKFRSKSPERAMAELVELARRHRGCGVQVVDNILDMGYFKTFLPSLAERRLKLGLFYETKANLHKDQVRMLRAAGIREIQPGIESFSDPVLKLMRKGVTGLQNIQLLKWCKEIGVEPHWNFLWGFPGEAPEEYARMTRLVPRLTHLTGPVGFNDIRLDRFSPNFFDAERLGFEAVAPLPAYRHVYALNDEALANLAYFFGFRYREPRDVDSYVRPLVRELWTWLRVEDWSDLFSVDLGELLLVWDQRPASRTPVTVLEGLDRILYRACDAVRDLRQLLQAAEGYGGGGGDSAEEIEGRLESLVTASLMVRDGSRFLALAIPLGEYSPPAKAVERFWSLARELARPTREGLVLPLRRLGGGVQRPRPGTRRRRSWSRRPRARRLTPSQFILNEVGELIVRRGPQNRLH